MLDGMSDSIQRSRIEILHSREVDRQSPTGLIFITQPESWYSFTVSWRVEGWGDLGTAGRLHTARAQGCKSQWFYDKHNCPQRSSIPGSHALQSGMLPLDDCDLGRCCTFVSLSVMLAWQADAYDNSCTECTELEKYNYNDVCVLMSVSLRREFLCRWTYLEFFRRYRVLAHSTEISRNNMRKTCEQILLKLIQVSRHCCYFMLLSGVLLYSSYLCNSVQFLIHCLSLRCADVFSLKTL